jgi:putative phage-type endonuclease
MKLIWEDRGNYWVSHNPQGSEEWYEIRKGRINASEFGSAVGHSIFKTPNEVALNISQLKPYEFTDYSLKIMEHGTKTEPEAREWYTKKYNVEVIEIGSAIPKWCPYIASSLDGEVVGESRSIEIKCPMKMYKPINNYLEKLSRGWKPSRYYHEHIWNTHYDQMIGGMAITEKQCCDYVVYCTPENVKFTYSVEFNERYWNEELYPKLIDFYNNKLKPLINFKTIIPE